MNFLTFTAKFATIVHDDMNQNEITSHLHTSLLGRQIYCFDTIESTNTFAKSIAGNENIEGTLIIADEQTSGKGRLGRRWESERGKNLTFSIILNPNIQAEYFGILSLLGGVAVTEAVRKLTGLKAVCKWPNDVMIGQKKICGILSESVLTNKTRSSVIVGIGLNVNQSQFSDELESKASSLYRISGKYFDRFEVLAALLERLEHYYIRLQAGDANEILNHWKDLSPIIGLMVNIQQGQTLISGRVTGIAPDGSLLLDQNGKETQILSGDVSILQSSSVPL